MEGIILRAMPQVVEATLGDLMREKPKYLRGHTLDNRRRRLSTVVGRHADKSRPFIVSVHNARSPLQPSEANVVLRKEQSKIWLRKEDVVLITYLPERGGAGGGGANQGVKTGIGIALAVAAVVLLIAAPYLAGPAFAIGSLTISWLTAIQIGLVVGGIALTLISSRSKANKKAAEERQSYGVSGGGNMPRPGDRIPVGYGRCWHKPDLSQPDASYFMSGTGDQVLLKRHTVAAGEYVCYNIRAGKQLVWNSETGYHAPFSVDNFQFELLYNSPSGLVPGDIITSTAVVGNQLPRPIDNPNMSGPFNINPTGPLVNYIVISLSFTNGITATITKNGQQVPGQPAPWGWLFEVAPIDASGTVTGPWTTLSQRSSDSEGYWFSQKPMNLSLFFNVTPGRYAVRGRNAMPLISTIQNNLAWVGLSGWVPDTRVRPYVTEIAMKIFANEAMQGAAFAEIELDMERKLPTFDGSTWGAPVTTRKAPWAFADVVTNQVYGGHLPLSRFDSQLVMYYATNGAITFNEFNGIIRGPVSVWEAAAVTLLPMRAEPVNLGRVWSMTRDEQQIGRRHFISRAKILKGSTEENLDLDAEDGSAHQIIEFDQDGDYRVSNSAEYILGTASITPTRRKILGIRDYDHAMHIAKWLSGCGFYRRERISLATELDARIYKRGQSAAVDIVFGDEMRAARVTDQAGYILTLDNDVTVAAGDHIILRDRRGKEWGPVTITQGVDARHIVLDAAEAIAVTNSTGLAVGDVLGTDSEIMTPALVGQLTVLSENFLVQSVKPSAAYRNDVILVNDAPEVWALLGEAIPGQPPVTFPLTDPLVPSISRVDVTITQRAASYAAEWIIIAGRGAVGFQTELAYDGINYSRVGTGVTGSVELAVPDTTFNGSLRSRAQGRTGLWGDWYYSPLLIGVPSVLSRVSVELEDLRGQLEYEVGLLTDPDKVGSIPETRAFLEQMIEELGSATSGSSSNHFIQHDALKKEVSSNFASFEQTLALKVTDTEARAISNEELTARIISNDVVSTSNISTTLSAYATTDAAATIADQEILAQLQSPSGTIAAHVVDQTAAFVTDSEALSISNTEATSIFNGFTATGRIRFSAAATPAGVEARFAIELKSDVLGTYHSTGLYLDLINTGGVRSGRIFLDANEIYMGAIGETGVAALQVVGNQVRIINLLVTDSAILPNAVQERKNANPKNNANIDLSGNSGGQFSQWVDIISDQGGICSVTHTVTVANSVSAVDVSFAVVLTTGPITGTTPGTTTVEIGLFTNGNLFRGVALANLTTGASTTVQSLSRAFNSSFLVFLDQPAQYEFRLMMRYSSNNPSGAASVRGQWFRVNLFKG